jgi:membrane protease YdiL (CAAX protease family)
MRALQVAMSGRAALVLTAVLIGIAHVPAAYGLRDPRVGWNPLVPFAAFGCGLVWGLLFLRTKRIVPSLFAHAFFTYAVVEWPLWRA